ncbi:MAG: hypothetical protein U0359_12120 [Byssovorax sp.]
MAAPSAVPAVPPTFHFKIRLVDATGRVFDGKDYQLWWGGKMVKEGQTSADGMVEADLDDNFDSGLLDLGERDERANFVARLTIPVEAVAPAPPPPRPLAAPPKKTPEKANPAPRERWTDEADPPPPMPVYPMGGEEDEDGWRRYQQQLQSWKDWQDRRAQRQGEAAQQQRADEDFRAQRQDEAALRREFNKQGGPIEKPKDEPAPPMSEEAKKVILDRLQKIRDDEHASKVLAYELTFRLRNLGYLPDSTELVFPISDSGLDRLVEASRRYAHKNGLPLPELYQFISIANWSAIKELSDAIKKEHDG